MYCRTNYTGFSSQLNELIADQGELAVVIEGSDDQYEITGYCLPSQKDSFDMDEIRNIYLVQGQGGLVSVFGFNRFACKLK